MSSRWLILALFAAMSVPTAQAGVIFGEGPPTHNPGQPMILRGAAGVRPNPVDRGGPRAGKIRAPTAAPKPAASPTPCTKNRASC